ncbi:MAG: hypothetical protein EPN84_11905 [Legionella sp.]|nr:MAG: hypothetical protein EPN84_11905 [Legionella sp.]
MNIYDYLKMDHDFVANLFKQFKNAPSALRKQQIMEMIAQELIVHAKSEQDSFYKALLQHPQSKEDAQHGKREHEEITNQINTIMNWEKPDAKWIKQVEKLQELVDHHVHEEEHSIFRHAKRVLSKEEAYILKEQMHFLKHKLLKRLGS